MRNKVTTHRYAGVRIGILVSCTDATSKVISAVYGASADMGIVVVGTPVWSSDKVAK